MITENWYRYLQSSSTNFFLSMKLYYVVALLLWQSYKIVACPTLVLTYGDGLALDGRWFLVSNLLDDVQDDLRDLALLPASYRVGYVAALKKHH